MVPRRKKSTNNGDTINTDNVNTNKKNKMAFNSVNRATKILVSLSKGLDMVNEIAEQCGLNISTTHRLLKTMEQSDLVVSNPIKHRYYLGPLISQLTLNPVTGHKLLVDYAIEEMTHLAEISEETITLSIAVGTQGILLHEIQSKHVLRVAFDSRVVGLLTPGGATPKVLLSQFSDTEVEAILKHVSRFNTVDTHPIDKDQLMTELGLIRQQGYIIHCGEKIEGALAISSPIKNYQFPACLSIVGYGNRALSKVTILVEELKKSADIVSSRLQEHLDMKINIPPIQQPL